jgi:hypothetical protein
MLTATLFVLLGEAAARPIALPQLRRPGLGAGNACASYEIVSARGVSCACSFGRFANPVDNREPNEPYWRS